MKLTQDQIKFWRAVMAMQFGPGIDALLRDSDIENFADRLQNKFSGANDEQTPTKTKPAPRRESPRRAALVNDVMKRLEE